MELKATIKPITYMETNAADILALVSERQRPVIITHNGEGKMVIQDIESYLATQRALTFLKLAAVGRQSVEHGRVRAALGAFDAMEARVKRRRGER
jgi:prevent-host-death family protein